MNVVLDSCIICKDFQLAGTQFATLLKGMQAAGARLLVPEIVMDEVELAYGAQLEDYMRGLRKLRGNLRRLTGVEVVVEPSEVDIERLRQDYGHELRRKLGEAGARFVPYPDTGHREIALRAMRRRKPFRGAGGGVTGYRDYLVWRAVVTAASSPSEMTAFITSNSRDFCVQSGEGLADELVSDLKEEGISIESVVLITSLEELNSRHIAPHLEEEDRIRIGLREYLKLDLGALLGEKCTEALEGAELESTDLWEDAPCLWPSISMVEEVDDIQVVEVRRLSATEVIANLSFRATCSVDAIIEKGEYFQLVDRGWAAARPFIFATDAGWSESGSLVWLVDRFTMEADVVIDTRTRRVTSTNVGSIRATRRFWESYDD